MVPFPTAPARLTIVTNMLPRDRIDASADVNDLVVSRTEGYSGAPHARPLSLLPPSSSALLPPPSSLSPSSSFPPPSSSTAASLLPSGSDLVLVCKEAGMRPLRRLLTTLEAMHSGGRPEGARPPQPGPVTADDLAAALAATKPTAHSYVHKYEAWDKEFGSV